MLPWLVTGICKGYIFQKKKIFLQNDNLQICNWRMQTLSKGSRRIS